LTLQGHIAWFINSYLHNTFRYDYVIAEKASQTRIGTIGVSNLDYHKKSCVLSYMIAVKAYQRRGFAGEAIVAMMERVKREGIEVFIAEIHQDNIASLGTVEKLGFLQYSQEGNFLLFRHVR
jgi:RimJ/RimL family protein N-acetyltransferase